MSPPIDLIDHPNSDQAGKKKCTPISTLKTKSTYSCNTEATTPSSSTLNGTSNQSNESSDREKSSSSLSLPSLSPVLDPVKRVLSNTTSSSIKSFIRKSLFSDQLKNQTEGPITKQIRLPTDVSDRSLDNNGDNDSQVTVGSRKLGYVNELLEPPKISDQLISGLPILKISKNKRVQKVFKIDLEQALVTWNNGKEMSIDNILQITTGCDAASYREEFGVSEDNSETWSSITYTNPGSNKLKYLHLISRNKQEFNLFVSTLTNLVSRRREIMKYLAIPGDNFANIRWENFLPKCNKDKELLSFEDILKLTKRLHINCDNKLLHNLFKEADTDKKNALNFNQFQTFVKKLKTRPELKSLFKTITNGSNALDIVQFKKFVRETQKQKEPDDVITKWFMKYSDDGKNLTLDNFINYLTSSYVSFTKNETEDLTRPFNEYFISTSHNTYLIGRQFGSSSSSTEGYIKALTRGCRSIEIDVWDGDSGPVIRHGKLTGSIQVKDVLQVVRKYAFMLTPYPLFLSIEIHCKIDYQFKLKELILDILGDMLVTKPIMSNFFRLPSPEELKHKILIKVKKPPAPDATSTADSSGFATSSSTTTYSDMSNEESKSSFTIKKKKSKKKQPKIVPELSALGVYASGLKFRNFSLPESKAVNHVFSFSESNFNTMVKDPEKKYLIMKHNRRYVMRLYPSTYRYNSTNFIPINFWNYGAQMVATNWQTYDLGQEINEAMFNHGKGPGYVLKPLQLRNSPPNLKFKLMKSRPCPIIKFKIEIISGQLFPRPAELKTDESLNPYVAFELIDVKIPGGVTVTDIDAGIETVSSSNVNQTKTILSNGFNPVWNYRFEGKFESLNGLDFIRFQVKTGEITFAVNCIKLDTLNQGYRHIPLYDLQGEEYIFSTLFINVSYEKL